MICKSNFFAAMVGLFITTSIVNAQQTAGISVAPVRVELAGAQTTALVTVGNNTGRTIALQTSAVLWEQVDGKEVQSSTRDVLTAPPLIEIENGKTQTVRVALRVPPLPDRERSYRLLLREVPPSNDKGEQSFALSFAFNLSLPIFIAPAAQGSTQPPLSATAEWRAGANRESGQLAVRFVNAGSLSVQVARLKQDAKELSGLFYVLPQSERLVVFAYANAPTSPLNLNLTTAKGEVKLDVPVRRAQ
jgi:fimbrial chaperone protein